MTKKLVISLVYMCMCTLILPARQLQEYPEWVNSTVSQMSLKEKVGQLLIYSLPSKANIRYKRALEEVLKEYNIGGIMYSSGNIGDQITLVNAVQRFSKVPLLLSVNSDLGMSAYVEGAPDFPHRTAVQFVADNNLKDAYHKELKRIYGVVGVHTDEIPEGMMLTSAFSLEYTRNKILNSVKTGEIPEEEINEKCKKVLAAKYGFDVHKPAKVIDVKTLPQSVVTSDGLQLASDLRRASITVLGNYAPVIPLSKDNVAILCLGDEDQDTTFIASMKDYATIQTFRLTDKSDEETRNQVAAELKNYKRVIVNITAEMIDVRLYRRFLSELDVTAPLVYIAFTPYRAMQILMEPMKKTAVVVLAHDTHQDTQKYVADLLFAQAESYGKLPVDISRQFTKGDGEYIQKGMQAGAVPEDYGMKSYVLNKKIDHLLDEAIQDGAFPGCQVLILKDGETVYEKTLGVYSDKNPTPVTSSSMYDLAELTQTTGTLLGVMKLVDEGKLKLDDKISVYLYAFRTTDKQDITIQELLFHESGLLPYIRFYQQVIDDNTVKGPFFQGFVDDWHYTRSGENTYACSDFKFIKGLMSEQETSSHHLHMAENMWLNDGFKHTMIQSIAKSEYDGKRYIYSNLSFLVLQQVIEAITGMSLDQYLNDQFYSPMGLTHTMFLPLRRHTKDHIIPTVANDYLRRQDLHGYVHDETAACLGGIAGNAGLFSTSTEVAQIYLMLLNGGEYKGKRYLSDTTCKLFTTEKSTLTRRGLGFDRSDPGNRLTNPCSPSTPEGTYGQVGFTGTSVWADPINNIIYVFLSNRVCPHPWNLKMVDSKLVERIQEVIYDSMK